MLNGCYDNRKNESFRASSDHSNVTRTMCSVFLSLHGMSPKSWLGTHKQASQDPWYCLSVFRCQRFIFPQELALTTVEREVKGVTSQTEESTRWASRESHYIVGKTSDLLRSQVFLDIFSKRFVVNENELLELSSQIRKRNSVYLKVEKTSRCNDKRRFNPDKVEDIYRIAEG